VTGACSIATISFTFYKVNGFLLGGQIHTTLKCWRIWYLSPPNVLCAVS